MTSKRMSLANGTIVAHIVCYVYSTWKKGEEFQFEKVDAQNSNQQSSGNIIQLRRVNCTHPSNQAFQRLLVFVTGKLLNVSF